jgi:hypothetical protein
MMVSAPPGMTPMKVTLGAGAQARQMQQQTAAQQAGIGGIAENAFVSQSDAFESLARSRYENISKGIKAELELNTIAISNQMIELEADRRMLLAMKERAVAVRQTEGVSVMYSLKGKLTLPSRTEQQILNIASFECPAAFVFVASPLLTDYVYLQADNHQHQRYDSAAGAGVDVPQRNLWGDGYETVTSGQYLYRQFWYRFADSGGARICRYPHGCTARQPHQRAALPHRAEQLQEHVGCAAGAGPDTVDGKSIAGHRHEGNIASAQRGRRVPADKNGPRASLRWDMPAGAEHQRTTATILKYVYTMKYDKSLSCDTQRGQ